MKKKLENNIVHGAISDKYNTGKVSNLISEALKELDTINESNHEIRRISALTNLKRALRLSGSIEQRLAVMYLMDICRNIDEYPVTRITTVLATCYHTTATRR